MQQSHEVRSTGTKIARALIWVFLLFIAVITIFPVLYVVFGSFKENKELLVGGANIFPSVWVIQNYVDAWKQANFARYTMNSLYISLGVMVLSLINATMAGYVFSRRKSKFKSILYSVFIAFMFINVGSVSLRPLYELAVGLKMNKSLIFVILISVGGGQATYIFLCRGFTDSLPRELDEAATIDGASQRTYLFRILLPLSGAAIATITLFYAVDYWNSYFYSLIYITRRELLPMQAILRQALMTSEFDTMMYDDAIQSLPSEMLKDAMIVVTVLPIICVYPFIQRYFVKGVMVGSVKG